MKFNNQGTLKMKITVLMLMLFLGLSACSSSPDMTRAPAIEATAADVQNVQSGSAYTLDAGDVIRVIVFGDQELSGEFEVDSSGSISMPLIQGIDVAGKTVSELEKAITDKLQPAYLDDPKVSVQVVAYRSIYVLGEVRLPGKYPYVPNMTVLQAVAVAGGYTYRASEGAVDVSRQNNGEMKKFEIRSEGYLMPGDTIVVGRRWF